MNSTFELSISKHESVLFANNEFEKLKVYKIILKEKNKNLFKMKSQFAFLRLKINEIVFIVPEKAYKL